VQWSASEETGSARRWEEALAKGSLPWGRESHRRNETLAASKLVRKGVAESLEKGTSAIWAKRTSSLPKWSSRVGDHLVHEKIVNFPP
jgi:hypothetical protein